MPGYYTEHVWKSDSYRVRLSVYDTLETDIGVEPIRVFTVRAVSSSKYLNSAFSTGAILYRGKNFFSAVRCVQRCMTLKQFSDQYPPHKFSRYDKGKFKGI